MRTSNKIILSLILTAVLLFTGLFLTVRIKYANGAILKRDAIKEQSADHWANIHKIDGPIKSVLIKGLTDVMIVPSKSPRVEISKDKRDGVTWRFDNGILTVMVDTTNGEGGEHRMARDHVEIFLPATDSITFDNCTAYLKNTGETSEEPSYKCIINQSIVHIQANKRENSDGYTRYGALRLDARNSTINMDRSIWINDLTANLHASRLEETEGGVEFAGHVRINLDNFSILRISGQNLRKANITSTE